MLRYPAWLSVTAGLAALGVIAWLVAGDVYGSRPGVRYTVRIPGRCTVFRGAQVMVGGVQTGVVTNAAAGPTGTCDITIATKDPVPAGSRIWAGPVDPSLGTVVSIAPGHGPSLAEGSLITGFSPQTELESALSTLLHTAVKVAQGQILPLLRARAAFARLVAHPLGRLGIRLKDVERALTLATTLSSLPSLPALPGPRSVALIRSMKNDLPSLSVPLGRDQAAAGLARLRAVMGKLPVVERRAMHLHHRAYALFRKARHGTLMELAQDRRLFDDLKEVLFNAKNAPIHFLLRKPLPVRW